MKIKNKTCKLCGKKLMSDYNRPKIWCSVKCKNDYNNKHKIHNYKLKTGTSNCKTCGVEIPARLKVCGKQCYERQSKWQSIQRFKIALSNHYLIIPTK